MSTKTINYELIKPADNEAADITVINENYDRIDAALSPTADPAQAPVSNGPGNLGHWVSWITNRIKAITGISNWYDGPPTNLQAAADHISAVSPHIGHARTSDLTAHLADYTLQVPFANTTNVGNAYSIVTPAIDNLVAGMAVSIKTNADSTGATTLNWNGKGDKAIKKVNGANVINLKENGIYTLRYDGANFILQGEGVSGNATASDLLSGKTASTDAGDIVGTMPNRGAVVITPSTVNQAITNGYHNGSGYVAGDADLIAANIKSGVNIFGVTGTMASGKLYYQTTTTPISTLYPFFTDGDTEISCYRIDLTNLGLSFTPTKVMIWSPYGVAFATTIQGWGINNSAHIFIGRYSITGVMAFKMTNCYITSNAVRLPITTQWTGSEVNVLILE